MKSAARFTAFLALAGYASGGAASQAREACVVRPESSVGELLPNGICFGIPDDLVAQTQIKKKCKPSLRPGWIIGDRCVAIDFNLSPPQPDPNEAITALSDALEELRARILMQKREIDQLQDELRDRQK